MARKLLKANAAAAHAARLAGVAVIPAFPITPSTLFPEQISAFVANGEMECQFLPTESEHSAMSACIGASATGVRTCTATASQGLALMHEMLFAASGIRLPIVMAVGNRALSAPINIWADHSDMMSERDSGWIQFFAEKNQEALDLMLIAFRVCEDKTVLLPGMVGMDAFILTHTMEGIDLPEQAQVDAFLPRYNPTHCSLNPEHPITIGSFASPDYYMEFKFAQELAMQKAAQKIEMVFEEFFNHFARKYSKVSGYHTEDAEIILITIGSMTGTARAFIDKMQNQGKKVGLVKLTVYRPFPGKELIELIRNSKAVAVVERAFSYGMGGPVHADLCSAIQSINSNDNMPNILSYIIGLGGREITISDFEEIYLMARGAKSGTTNSPKWINVDEQSVIDGEQKCAGDQK